MDSRILGYTASTTSLLAFGFQFVHTLRCGTLEGISLPRTVFDTASLSLWVVYATRTEDVPLLIACSCELILSFCICLLILRHHFYGSCTTLQDAPASASASPVKSCEPSVALEDESIQVEVRTESAT